MHLLHPVIANNNDNISNKICVQYLYKPAYYADSQPRIQYNIEWIKRDCFKIIIRMKKCRYKGMKSRKYPSSICNVP